MAATMTGAGELTYASFPIDKVETDADGDLIVYGKASDGSIDSDQQIVDPAWMALAAQAWKESGANLRVQHNAQRDPAGVGLEVETDSSGATWVKGLVVEPIAKKLVAKGALRAYSVGISRPTITRDAAARGGRITDGELVEISLVDRPANKRCGIQLVKSVDGTPEYVNEVFGAEADIAKALGADVTKGADDDMVNVDLPRGASISISPADFAKLHTFKQELVTKTAATAEATEKRDVSTAERRDLAGDHNALPDGSYPIKNTGDLENAAVLARSGHGDVAAARRLIARRAGELGVPNPLDESDGVKKSEPYTGPVEPIQEALEKAAAERPDSVTVLPPAVKEAEPDVIKDPEPEDKPKPVKKAKKKPKKLPPWLNKPSDDDGKDDSGDDSSKSAAEPAECKLDHAHTEKCHTDPAQAAGVTASQMSPAPVKELQESQGPASVKGATPASASSAAGESMQPVPAHREPDGAPVEAMEADAGLSDGDDEKPTRLEAATGMKAASADLAPDPEVAALLRFKALGADEDLGRLHDLTCPAYSPEMAAKYHPFADLPGLIDSGTWQRKTLAAAAGPLEKALEMAELWQAVHVLKNTGQAALNDWRLELHKAFRDANPGPGSFPTPGCVSPQRYNRPVLGDGRAANAADYSGPNTAPQVATTPPNAQSFDRPPLSSGQQSPSPSFMKGGGAAYPAERGVPQQISYEQVERDKARRSLAMLHDHLGHMFPSMCPMLDQDAYRQPESRPVPQPAGIGKAIDPEPAQEAPAATFKATPEDGDLFTDAEVYKGFKKARKKLGKKVLSGKMTVDEARSRLGRQFAQKAAEPVVEEPATGVEKGLLSQDQIRELAGQIAAGVTKAAAPAQGVDIAEIVKSINETQGSLPVNPEVIKAAVAEASTELKDLLVKQQETFTEKLAEQQRVIDAIADQPDPGTAAFSGLAFQPQVIKSGRPAAVPDQAEYAARAQQMIRRNLQNTYQTHSNPHVREAAGSALANLGVPEVAS